MEPAVGCRMQDLTVEAHPGMHRYAKVHGLPALVDGLCEEVERNGGGRTLPENVLVTAGGTGGLAAVVGAILNPGEKVVILAPFWPLIGGMVRAFGGEPVVLPFIDAYETPADAAALLEAVIDDQTVAVYWNTPNNPTGRRIPPEVLDALLEVARRHDLWVLADEVYEHYVYAGRHTSTRARAPERTVSIHSFSKAYGMAGNRVGYVVGPADLIDHTRRIATHTYYSAPTAGQWAALHALGPAGRAWIAEAHSRYAELGAWAAERLGERTPEGSTFLFVDVADHLDERGLPGLLEQAVERGLLVAPGSTFGPYPTHIRVCFTSVEPRRIKAGIEVLAELLGR